MIAYRNRLEKLTTPPALLADYPEFVEPLRCDDRYQGATTGAVDDLQ